MTPDFDPDAVIDACAPMIGLTVTEAQRAAVRTHLLLTAGIAAPLLRFTLEDDAEPGFVFTP